MSSGDRTGQYQFTAVDYNHPDPRLRSASHVSVHLQTDVEEIVAGASIEVGDLVA